MAQTINKLQARTAKFSSLKHTDLNYFATLNRLKPEIFTPISRLLFASKTNSINFSDGNPYESIFGLGKTRYIDDINYKWKGIVKGYRPMTVLENKTIDNEPGKYRSDINVLFDEDLGAIGEQWTAGVSDKSQVLNIVRKVKQGKGYLYTMRTFTDGEEHFIKPEYLSNGHKWTRMYSLRGEAAESGGHAEGHTEIEYQSNVVKLRKKYKVTDYAAQAVVELGFYYNGEKIMTWMPYQELRYDNELDKECFQMMKYSKLSDKPLIDPDSGYPISPFAGMQQQISFGGNVERYTTLTAELIEAFFDKIVYSRISPGDLGEVVGFSGHYGMKEFSKALDTWTRGRGIVRQGTVYNKEDSVGVHNTSLRAGYQYTLFDLPNGGSFRLIHDPINDDRSINREIDPTTGYPIESQRITILDVTGGNGQSINKRDNIVLVRKNKVKGTTIVEGRVGPGGGISKNPTHSGDYYTVDKSDSIGIQIQDPTVTGELIKTVA